MELWCQVILWHNINPRRKKVKEMNEERSPYGAKDPLPNELTYLP